MVFVVLIVVLVTMKGVGRKSDWTLCNICQGTFNAVITRDASWGASNGRSGARARARKGWLHFGFCVENILYLNPYIDLQLTTRRGDFEIRFCIGPRTALKWTWPLLVKKEASLTHCGRMTQICVFNTVKLGTSASSP